MVLMRLVVRCVTLLWLAMVGSLGAQEFLPPPLEEGGGIRLGLMGFGVRGGFEFEGDDQAIVGVALDLGNLGAQQVRPRASLEIGLGGDANTYVTSLELVLRFTSDREVAVPYIGLGLAVYAQQDCDMAMDPSCPELWANTVLGFELRLRPSFNWFLEYHSLDAFRRHRLLIGLSTRRGT